MRGGATVAVGDLFHDKRFNKYLRVQWIGGDSVEAVEGPPLQPFVPTVPAHTVIMRLSMLMEMPKVPEVC